MYPKVLIYLAHVSSFLDFRMDVMLVDDIEDFSTQELSAERVPMTARGVRVRRRPQQPSEDSQPPSHVPGIQSVYVKTYGCSHNHSDSEYMCGLLSEYGYKLIPEAEKERADVWLINSCTVKNPSQDHLATDIRRAKALQVPIVVAGCVGQVLHAPHQ